MSNAGTIAGRLAHPVERLVEVDRSLPEPLRNVLHIALLALSYWLAARLSLNLALVRGQVTPIWPPTGIALVGILILGRRAWPAITVAAFVVNLPIGPSPIGVAFIAAGNTLAPLVSLELLTRAGFRVELDRLRDAVALVVLGALVGMTVSATVGTSVLILFGSVPVSNLASTWAVWWTGDAMGVLLVAPVLLALWPRPGWRRIRFEEWIGLVGLLIAVGAVTYFLFQNRFRLEYLVLPLIMAAAWRFRLRGAAPAALLASIVGVWAAVNGDGPFASETLLEKMITLQGFNVSVSLASLVLALFVETREQRLEISRQYESATLAIAAKATAINEAARELIAPLAILTSYFAILSDGQLGLAPEKWIPVLRVMADKAWQLHRKIDDVLEAASIESNTLPAQKSDVDLRDVVKRAVERARSRAELTGARITTTLGPDRVPVDADPRQLGRILDNLLNNGLTFTTRLPRLEVTSIAEHERAIVRVSDNGVGFSETERDSVFEPFHPTQNPSFADLRGLGLGLYIARQLAEANTGRLSIERTSAGQGTVFALVLPLAKSTTHRQPHA